MKVKLSKNLDWLFPFLVSVEHLVPLHKLKNIRSYSVKNGLEEQAYGSIVRSRNNKSFSINLKTTINERKNKRKEPKPEFVARILETLAHELSHLVVWEHTSEHFALQAVILYEFAQVLKTMQIEDTYIRIDRI